MTFPKNSPLTLPLADYQRLVRVLRSLYEVAAPSGLPPALFFSVTGAIVLNSAYGLNAKPCAGAAAFRLHPLQPLLVHGGREPTTQELVVSEDNFHAWVECDGKVLDLCAPYFGDALTEDTAVPPKMFQKKLTSGRTHIVDVTNVGDFMLVPDDALKRGLLERFMAVPAHVDLVSIAVAWYKKPPQSIEPSIKLNSNGAQFNTLSLAPLELVGAW